ncbi:MAG: glycosyltransferase [Candidatus Moranbacteria bacterium]|nr:glycosyltransferase [Candidatus Moranbacteria bacterium]MDD3964811.1 glycosyltransferase [Candidatus Moranbacteria bacterium]
MKIALVHDYLVQYGGAERVLEAFTELFPYAPIYTLIYDKEAMHGVFENKRIYTSFLQHFPFSRKRHRFFPPLMPLAIEQFDLSKYDVVLSDSSSYAKGIITRPETLHICYMHTPMRYAWDDCQKYTQDFGFPALVKKIVPFFMNPIRLWDKSSADRVDHFLTNSQFVTKRIKKYYNKEALVVHPPVNVNHFFLSEERQDYFLIVGRLIAYKRHDIAIEAFNRLKLPLKIIGRGPELERLKKIAGPTIEFLGRVPEEELPTYYAKCRGFIFPQEEDFGIVAIEAMASGRPIIAYRAGDIVEHLEEGKMGVFFDTQTPEAIIDAVHRFRDDDYDPAYIRSRALPFDKERFKTTIKDYIEKALKNHLQS